MKQLIAFFVFLFIAVSAKAQMPNLIGKWLTDEEGDSAYIEFTADSLVYITTKDYSGNFANPMAKITDGGKNFPYTGNIDTVWVDFTFKTNAKKPHHLFFVMYHAGTKNPFLIIPFLMKVNPDKSLYLYLLEVDSDNSNNDGILYKSPQDWVLAEETIEQANNDNFLSEAEKLVLTRMKK